MIRPAHMEHPRRIVVMRALQLGDLLVAVPAFRALRMRFPDAEITLIGLSWACSFVQRFHQYIDRFVEFPGYPGLPERPVDEAELERFLGQQRAYAYDIAIQMHGSGRTSNAFVRSLGSAMTVGYYPSDSQRRSRGANAWFALRESVVDDRNAESGYVCEKDAGLTLGLPYPTGQPEILRNLALVTLLGCTPLLVDKSALPADKSSLYSNNADLEFPLTSEDDAEITALLPELVANQERPWIGMHPGSRSPARRWPAESFARVADTLVARWDARIVFTGGADEVDMVQEVMRHMYAPAVSLAGRTSLGGLAALIARLRLFISNDTGPAHIACAVDCASITLFGPAEFSRWAPLDQTRHPALRHAVECSPCGYWECPIDHRCLRRLTPETVLTVAERLVEGRFIDR